MTFPSYPPLPTYLETVPRYTTVDAVKIAIGIDIIPSPGITDAVITEAIVSIEALIDAFLGTSYPQDVDPDAGTDDALDPAPILGIPVQIQKAAKLGAISLVSLDSTPHGQAGSEEFFGVIEPDNAGRAFNSVKPLLMGLKRSWGIA